MRSDQMMSVTAGSAAGMLPVSFAVMMASVSPTGTETLPADTAQTAMRTSSAASTGGDVNSCRIGKMFPFL